jgi:hypothetical protein
VYTVSLVFVADVTSAKHMEILRYALRGISQATFAPNIKTIPTFVRKGLEVCLKEAEFLQIEHNSYTRRRNHPRCLW